MVNPGQPVSILLAEDDDLLTAQTFLEARLLNRLNRVCNGEELVDYLHRRGEYQDLQQSSPPELILPGRSMPRKDGREVLAEIKSDQQLRHLPVVALSTSPAEEDIVRPYQLGLNSFISKPVTSTQMTVRTDQQTLESWGGPPMLSEHELRLLIVEDDLEDFGLLQHMLRSAMPPLGLQLDHATSVRDALALLQQRAYDLLIVDYQLGEANGLDLLHEMKRRSVDAPVIFLTGQGGEEVAVEALKGGAADYLLKSKLAESSLRLAILYAIDLHKKEHLLCHAREAVRSSDERFRALVENSSDVISLLDAQGTITYVSQSIQQALGYAPAELIGKSALEFLHPDDIPAAQQTISECLRHPGVPVELEHRCRHRDGAWRHLETTGVNRLDVAAVGGIVINSRDVSARKRAEEEVHRLNRALRALSRCNEALIQTNDEKELLQVICRILVEEGEFRMAWVGRAEPDDDKHVQPVASAGDGSEQYVATARATWNESGRGRGPIGTAIRTGQFYVVRDIWNTLCFAPWREQAARRGYASTIALPLNIDSERWGALAIYSSEADAFDTQEVALLTELAANVSYGLTSLRAQRERHGAVEELRVSEERYRLLFERNLAGVFRSGLDGRLLECNESAWRMFGYDSRDEFFQRNARDLYADPAEREIVMAELRQHGHLRNREITMRRKDGNRIDVLCNLTLLADDAGNLVMIQGTLLDVTETRSLQQQLLQSHKMEAIGQLAGGIAHDFNNLLMVISSYSELLLDNLSDEKLRRQTEQIREAAKRASGLTGQLLAFSRKQVLAPQVLDLNSVVQETAKMLPRLIGENIEVALALAPQLGNIKADPVQIEQVIMNLAINARDAMPNGGTLVIETSNVELDEEYSHRHASVAPGKYVMLVLTDTGVGIDPAVQARIFEPFFTTKDRGKGTGLGLSTVYGIVKQSGGQIFLYSEVGRGTTFKVYLPRTEEGVSAAAADTESEAEPRGTETILIVEDEEAVRSATLEFLEPRGYNVLQAANGRYALRVARKFSGGIDLLLTDVVLPDISGPDLAQRLLAGRPDMKVLYMSGYTESTILTHEVHDMASIFLQKPFTFAALTEKIRKILPPKRIVKVA